MKKCIQSSYDPGIHIFIGSDIKDELYKALAEEVRKEFDKEILIELGSVEIFYSELV